jgi:release factor glutamine methyltransferase
LEEAWRYLVEEGVLLLEIGYDQGITVPLLAEEAGAYGPVEIIKDLAGKDRVAVIKRNENADRSNVKR